MAIKSTYIFTSGVLVYPGMSGWRFLSLPKKDAVVIKETHGKHARGWGSLPVTATVGKTTWNTSIFPDKQSGTYILPLKAQVRLVEDILDSETVKCAIKIRS